ncbi:hypothetical protein [Aestuariibaculum suncheonense]|uniref:Uncharacterized protein n=1 Tax=Aestuariibaculum suncheonense TaxID=1028745 RepID=A0A8J6QAA1_9FLAO|nr:hypothetical protein [Aestuariibaculum suncheonense]MBD0836527.1 hypothetical protein [Aestuariibaculum suncheonense]
MKINKYIDLYNESYSIHRKEATKIIKDRLITYNDKKLAFRNAQNKTSAELWKIEGNCLVNREDCYVLKEIFQKRNKVYQTGYELNIIDDINEKFINVGYKDFSFEEFVSDLAKSEAYNYVSFSFNEYAGVYEKMFELNRFDDFENMPEFNVIDYNVRDYDQIDLYRELCSLLKPEEDLEDNGGEKEESETCIKIEKEDSENYFKLEKKYIDYFTSEDCYAYLTDDFIDDQQTTHEDFVNVFMKCPETHSSEVNFIATTKAISFFLGELNNELFEGLTQTSVEDSKKFKTNNNRLLTQSNLAHSKRNATPTEKNMVRDVINHIKDNSCA